MTEVQILKDDPHELYRQVMLSGQMSAAQAVQHAEAGDLSAAPVKQARPQINWEPLHEFWRNNSDAFDWDELERAVVAAVGTKAPA